jgi:scyllo-inositol 2-dehydrogenase (NADP+)
MNSKINVGLASFGMSGRVFHAPLIHHEESLNLYGIFERSPKGSKEVYPGIRVFTSFDDMMKDRSIDLIIVNTPDGYHYDMAMAALRAGKHVVVEKPFTVTTAQAESLHRWAEKLQKKVFVFHNRRWDSDFLTLKKLTEENKLGELSLLDLTYFRYRPQIKKGHWREKAPTGAEILYNLGSHLIDQCLFLLGWPDQVFADLDAQRTGSKADDYLMMALKYGKMRVVIKSGYIMAGAAPKIMAFGTKGSWIKYGEDPQEKQLAMGIKPSESNFGQESQSRWGRLCLMENDKLSEIQIPTQKGDYTSF